MALTQKDVENIAHLARLEVKDTQVEGYVQNLSDILALVDQLQAVNTDNVAPLANPMDMVQRLRVDEVTEPNDRENLQSNAPAKEKGLFLVPRVIE
ncbi:Asp-tRNA(Asn)/Glu-tRNA(Gln) amidotransferase subunit GatC [Pokkaliibacter sp. CJK22405]|uniref:Asp-tRNA(Asn)/Glu-tRNA(Gln) amidotransferase subunit GatC n=1 Tax=Pokkaliibacter sp. CJK22405 TaxID=3384615 RepID=UPI0039851A3D